MSRARERQKRRKQRQQTTEQITKTAQQALPLERAKLPSVVLPSINRWLVLLPGALLFIVIVVVVLGLLNPPEVASSNNAIWLDRRWTLATSSDDTAQILIQQLQDHNVQTIFAYASSLKADGSWSGLRDGNNRFTEAEPILMEFVEQWRRLYPNADLYAWIEVATATPEGYRLDSEQIQNTVASFSQRMIETIGFDGVLIDAKPMFTPNDDYLDLLRNVRAEIGLNVTLVAAVPADLTPSGTDLNLAPVIAPGTEWDEEFKQRVALQADFVAVQAYNSYLEDSADYIEWVTYQVDTYTDAMRAIEADTRLFISIPNYAEDPPAHLAEIESIAPALDGIRRSLQAADAGDGTQESYVAGVAIFTDSDLDDATWRIFADKWSGR